MKNYIVDDLSESDIGGAVEIWVDQNRRYCGNSAAFPDLWRNNTGGIVGFLQARIQRKAARALRHGHDLCGYLTYDKFPFNGEMSSFVPALAHAVVEEHKEEGYLALYRSVSQEWVDQNIFNHMWTINYNDLKLRAALYDLGFGSYLIDAFACPDDKMDCADSFVITRASESDAGALFELIEESRLYYRATPIFLNREPYQIDDVKKLIGESNVFMAWDEAWDDKKAIGFINVSVSQENNNIDMSLENHGLLDEIGAYIQPGYRGGKGLGKQLLKKAFEYCRNSGVSRVHVDFETANPFANKFWRKYFDPMLLSVRRTINKNVNSIN